MALFPERIFGRKEVVTERPDSIDIPKELKEVVRKVETSFPATKKDAQGPQGQPLIQTPQTQPLTIQVPAPSTTVLEQTVKGSKEETSPWNAAFWLRAIKRAVFLGKQIIFGQPKVNEPV